jgi:hypothetical protein
VTCEISTSLLLASAAQSEVTANGFVFETTLHTALELKEKNIRTDVQRKQLNCRNHRRSCMFGDYFFSSAIDR